MKLDRFITHLDRISFLNIQVWDFSYHSLFRKYAGLYLFKAMIPHPLTTIRRFSQYRHFIRKKKNLLFQYKNFLFLPDESTFKERIKKQDTKPLIGLGFCLKPYIPDQAIFSCPSGRANHDCLYLQDGKTRQICLSCAIFIIACECLKKGFKVYVMTSAKDIAKDFLIPQIKLCKFPASILLLCPYSIQAILPALIFCEIDALLLAYNRGYCQDYKQWLMADRGMKVEMTALNKLSWDMILDLLRKSATSESRYHHFRREGNIFYPE